MSVLGISAFYHDSAAAIVAADGSVIAAAQEERFSRLKGDRSFPVSAIKFCADYALNEQDPVELVVFYEDPLLKFERILDEIPENASATTPSAEATRKWLSEELENYAALDERVSEAIGIKLPPHRFRFANHHLSHAASAFYPSPFTACAVLVVDGIGEDICTSIWDATEQGLTRLTAEPFPNSLGLLYSAFTSFLGFKVNSGEYKVMGLAPFGRPIYTELLKQEFVSWSEHGNLCLKDEVFGRFEDFSTFEETIFKELGVRKRTSSEPLLQVHADLASSIQEILEEAMSRLVSRAIHLTGKNKVAMAGGVALNAVANGKVLEIVGLNPDQLWVQPAAGDAGAALGAAFIGKELLLESTRRNCATKAPLYGLMRGSLLGPSYSDDEVLEILRTHDVAYNYLSADDLYETIAKLLADGNIVGWHQGRSEFGPRALGSRSILCDARIPDANRHLNLAIKKREPFRPFAPAILEEHYEDWFESGPNPFMLRVVRLKREHRVGPAPEKFFDPSSGALLPGLVGASHVPAVTHVDFSSRPQSVGMESNKAFRKLLESFYAQTDCPLLLNTSFNVRGEPIVERPLEALAGLVTTEMDYLCVGNFLVKRLDQDPLLSDLLTQVFPED